MSDKDKMWVVSVGWRIVIADSYSAGNIRKKIQDEIATPASSRFAMTKRSG